MASTGERDWREFAIVVSSAAKWQERRAFILNELEVLNGITLKSTELLKNAVAPSQDKMIIRGLFKSCREEDFENLVQFVEGLNGRGNRRVCSLCRVERKTIKTQRDSRKTRGFKIPTAARITCCLLFVAKNVWRVFGECTRTILLPFNILFLS